MNEENKKLKIIIVGGGVAGLSAGINALLNGYDATIYEKNSVAGGECSYWTRGDFTIDNCIHWLIGTKEGEGQYKEWVKLGVLGDNVKILKRKYFYKSELNGESISLWRDLDKCEAEMLALSKEDEREIKRFTNVIRIAKGLIMPKENMFDWKNAFSNMNLSVSVSETMKLLFEYCSDNLENISSRFHHPLLKRLFLDFSAKEYEAYWLILSYSFFVYGNADVPIGGSKGMANRMIDLFKSLGGKIYLNTPVKKLIINPKKHKFLVQIPDYKAIDHFKLKNMNMRKVNVVVLENGEMVYADYVICACDINYTFNKLLDDKYKPRVLKKISKGKACKIYSAFQVAFSVDDEMNDVDDFIYFDCKEFRVGCQNISRIGVKNYRDYGDYIAPKGKTVIQCMIIQYIDDFKYWNKLKGNIKEYQNEKKRVANDILDRIEEKFPKYKGKIHVLDAWTPLTYSNRNNCYYGAFMRFITGIANMNAFMSCDIKGISNVFLASHWLRYPGGLPTAASMGELAVNRIINIEKIKKNDNEIIKQIKNVFSKEK